MIGVNTVPCEGLLSVIVGDTPAILTVLSVEAGFDSVYEVASCTSTWCYNIRPGKVLFSRVLFLAVFEFHHSWDELVT